MLQKDKGMILTTKQAIFTFLFSDPESYGGF